MATTSLTSFSSPLIFHPLISHNSPSNLLLVPSSKRSSTRVFAARREAHDQNYSGRLVDSNMIVLRKRIHEMKMLERNYEPPSHWMEWEKHCFTSYDSFICEVVGVLQSQLMNTRPSFALGLFALIAFSVPISSTLVFSSFFEISKIAFGGFHFG
ncbi:hypothetical protein P3X46_022960 [Hevea brasiliensis]|uniref:Mediator of RNA polymerase II transcription subunit n=1 Tax=Hevea brasiliensis TaxID=3981 RepID=A0ABQ9LBD6_HEVBR|nr:uncharacterized protein LOC110650451 [Hevea brasiliensis]XP_057987613.1 uncharacterized protein LOC131171723 [Hevea brasiliensis]KAJ9163233.1 hypothetical protein P3X46_022924 [Hevea brasiliensis]KAJ9163276.1 hypothetical protein P3X46_022960 [Hevea brasiliensis]